MSEAEWSALLGQLERHELTGKTIAQAIVRLGKPLEADRIQRAKTIIAEYLSDPDPWVRHEAMWFLGSWAQLTEYEPRLRRALVSDIDPDNRAYAAWVLGELSLATADVATRIALARVVSTLTEEEDVRLAAYLALLLAVNGPKARRQSNEFLHGRFGFGDIDWQLVEAAAKQEL